MKKTESNDQSFFPEEKTVDLSMALLINGKSLEPQPVKHSTPVECKFKSDKEFTELVVNNSKMLFGKNTILIDATKSPLQCYCLLVSPENEQPRIHFVDITLSRHDFWGLFSRITRLFARFLIRQFRIHYFQPVNQNIED